MFGAKRAFRGRVYESYEEMRRDIMHFLEDHPPNEAVGMDIGNIGEEQQREEEQEEGDAYKKNEGNMPESDMIGNIYAEMFGGIGESGGGWNGWGNSQGKGGKYGYQPNYGPWGRQTWQNQNWQSEKGETGGKCEKGQKGEGKGKGQGKGKECWRCGNIGHIARDCYTNIGGKGGKGAGGLYEFGGARDEGDWREAANEEPWYPEFLGTLIEDEFPKSGHVKMIEDEFPNSGHKEKGEEWSTAGLPDVTRFVERKVKFGKFNNGKKVKLFDWHGEDCSCNSFEMPEEGR